MLKNKTRKIVERFHQDHPLLVGFPTDVITRQMEIPKAVQPAFLTMLQQEGVLEIISSHVRLPNREIKYSPAQGNRIKSFLDQNVADPYNPPTVKASKEILGEEIYESLIDQELIVQLSQEVVLSKQAYQQMVDYVKEECKARGSISVIDFRDHFSTNRKTSLGLLEHLDSKGVTKRQGDVRVLIKM